MAKAIIVETRERAAVIAIPERRGFRFHAADALFRPIDDRIFGSFRELQRAASVLDAAAASR